MAVERERPLAVLDDDEVAVAGELSRKRDDALVDGPDRLPLGAVATSMPFRTIDVPNLLLG